MKEMIKVLIVEDEDAAVNRLHKELSALTDVHFEILQVLASVRDTVSWLKSESAPDLILMDIHLTDGLSLEIFKAVEVTCPVIFTTAYDEYALQAFKVNSVDYLLKPIDPEELSQAIDKFLQRREKQPENYLQQLSQLAEQLSPSTYRSSFLVNYRQKMLLLDVNEVAYFYIKERGVFLKKRDGQEYLLEFFLDDLEKQLDPRNFYRANRQFLVARHAIKEIEAYFNGRLLINVEPAFSTTVTISKEKATHFKRWADY